MFIRVDLPEPLEPISATNSPRLNFERHAAHGVHFHFAGAIRLANVVELNRTCRSAMNDAHGPPRRATAERIRRRRRRAADSRSCRSDDAIAFFQAFQALRWTHRR